MATDCADWAAATASGPGAGLAAGAALDAGAADVRASIRSRRVTMSEIVGSFVGKSTVLESTTELKVASLEVAVSSTAVPWIMPVRWNV